MVADKEMECCNMLADISLEFMDGSKFDVSMVRKNAANKWNDVVLAKPILSNYVRIVKLSLLDNANDSLISFGILEILVFACNEEKPFNDGIYICVSIYVYIWFFCMQMFECFINHICHLFSRSMPWRNRDESCRRVAALFFDLFEQCHRHWLCSINVG